MGGRLRKDKLSEEQIGERLAAVDAYEASGLSGEAFAQSRGIRYLICGAGPRTHRGGGRGWPARRTRPRAGRRRRS